MPVQLQYVQVITDKTIAADLSTGVFAILTPRRYAERGICYANSVCPSVTRVICIKTAERIIEFLSLSDRPVILVFRHQGSLRNVTPNGAPNTRG